MTRSFSFNFILFLSTGVLLSFLFVLNMKVPIYVPLLTIILSLALYFRYLYRGVGSFLVGIMMVFFAAPVLPLMLYFINDEINWGWTPELIAVIDYDLNWKIAISIAVGCTGLLIGSLISSSKLVNNIKVTPAYNPLSMFGFKSLSLVAILLSYMSAPTGSIFAGEYGGDQLNTIALAINFPAAYLLSYSVFIALAIDLVKDRTANVSLKTKYLALSIGYVAIFLQFMRGDREIVGLFIALMVLYIISPSWGAGSKLELRGIVKARFVRCLKISGVGVIFLLALGILRFSVSYGVYDLSNLFQANPWVMALTSFAAFFSSEESEKLVYGETYIQYLLSLPPGFITNIFDIKRSIEADSNLAARLVDTGMTSGGAHVGLVGLQNFGMLGLFVIMMIYGGLARLIETHAIRTRGISVFVWLNLIAAVPIWFWYGEMTAIRAIMGAIIAYGLITLSILKRRRSDSFKNHGVNGY